MISTLILTVAHILVDRCEAEGIFCNQVMERLGVARRLFRLGIELGHKGVSKRMADTVALEIAHMFHINQANVITAITETLHLHVDQEISTDETLRTLFRIGINFSENMRLTGQEIGQKLTILQTEAEIRCN